ncbi:DUF1549 domain-containing protein [Lignipirellula cremea]|uniref:Xanthan lyase n=1 Tax=Lignipirellula cremea TaxID=2528010 RepID=A0A518DX44_9BACT|nr:DUF1549 domain-containing protein [Lignipirellula cremea]QDU96426.1 hypothetical protein Pla8534_42460 [Lignipirellula cremea]
MPRTLVFAAAALLFTAATASANELSTFPGLWIDNVDAQTTGVWKESKSVRPYIGSEYLASDDPEAVIRYRFTLPKDADYHLLLSYSAGSNRASNVPVLFTTAEGPQELALNQKVNPTDLLGFQRLGEFPLKAGEFTIEVAGRGANGYIIADAAWLLTTTELEAAKKLAKTKPPAVASKAANAPEPPPEPAPPFNRPASASQFATMTSDQLDELLAQHLGPIADDQLIDDPTFLRRASLDLLGRQPTVEELESFIDSKDPNRRQVAVDRMLDSPDFGSNWSNYWCDTIAARQQEPELTFHDYRPFKAWLAEQLNQGQGWDETVYQMLTANGKVGDAPEATFIGFHQGNSHRLAGETSRVFLSVQIHCAECHDHPFIDMPQETFHGMAAFFARTDAKIAQLDSRQIEVKSKTKGEHTIAGKKGEILPTAFDNQPLPADQSDIARRSALARWITAPENSYFAASHVNRVWSRLMGVGFYDPVDNMGEDSDPIYDDVLAAVSGHLVASQYNPKSVMRLIIGSRAYRRRLDESAKEPLTAAVTKQIRGDEVFDSLATAIALPNFTPEREKKSAAVRFPPPPKSTRDLVNEAFGYDPSFRDQDIPRTMTQAMFLMNNPQVQDQINAQADSGTFLASLLAGQPTDSGAIERLYEAVLARRPQAREVEICLAHIKTLPDRGAAFEDLLWSLLNSAEFTTRR